MFLSNCILECSEEFTVSSLLAYTLLEKILLSLNSVDAYIFEILCILVFLRLKISCFVKVCLNLWFIFSITANYNLLWLLVFLLGKNSGSIKPIYLFYVSDYLLIVCLLFTPLATSSWGFFFESCTISNVFSLTYSFVLDLFIEMFSMFLCLE